MDKAKTARIIGCGSYLPEKILDNKKLESMVETSDEWIVSRTGISERRMANAEEHTSTMGISAAKKAIAQAKIDPLDIDLIIVATCTPDYLFPSTGAIIQREVGAKNAAAFDLQAACTGYLFALSIAKGYIESGNYKNILIVASEKISSIVDYKDRNTCILFGDGASASVISDEGKGLEIRNVSLGTDGNHANLLILPGGGSRIPSTEESVKSKKHYLKMEGREVFKHAVRIMESAAKQCLGRVGVSEEEISWLVPHQANIRIITAIAKRFGLPIEKVYRTVHKYGNTSASGVAIALEELLQEKNVAKNDNILLVAFGSGLTWGASLLTQN
ncbi:MAG: 3-oxoacyl-[acyl-carrier-protein] synthase 3 [Chlamydiae bacterium]|nr:3-oxoacyl-[acyl-carrier-protein] synthase 3 [Chlamydiota bacterium]